MGSVRVDDEIAAPIDRVWAKLENFGDVSAWAPGEPTVTLEGGDGRTVGVVRNVVAGDQPPIRERLAAYDAAAHTFDYAIDVSPFPFQDYQARVELQAKGDRTAITWSGSFTPLGMPDEQVGALLENVYGMFIGKLKETLAKG
jgi:hypothetical protein